MCAGGICSPTPCPSATLPEFGEVVTTYLGMESPALRGLAGRSIPCGHRRHTECDAHGFQLGLATLPGAVHTIVHNGCSFELWRMMREAGVFCEVEPRHLFNTLLPAAYLLQPGPRPNIVPDARMDVALPPAATTRQQSQAFRWRTGAVAAQQRPMLFDAKSPLPLTKSIFAGGGRYRGSAEVREDQSGAVELRARQVLAEYGGNARVKDHQFGLARATLSQDRGAAVCACRVVVLGNYGSAPRDENTLNHVRPSRSERTRGIRNLRLRFES